MSTRLLLQLAVPVLSLKKHAAPVRCLLNTARYPLKTRYRHVHATAYNTEKVHRPSKIRRATQHRSHVRVLRNVSEPPLREYFCREYFCPPLNGSDSRKFSVAKILRRTYIDLHFPCILV